MARAIALDPPRSSRRTDRTPGFLIQVGELLRLIELADGERVVVVATRRMFPMADRVD